MKKINLKKLYPEIYKTDIFLEVSDEVWSAMTAQDRDEANQERKIRRYRAYYSLDCPTGIENLLLYRPGTPEEILISQSVQERLYKAVKALPEKQAKRIYAYFYLGMSKVQIARCEGVDESAVRRSIREGLQRLFNMFRDDF